MYITGLDPYRTLSRREAAEAGFGAGDIGWTDDGKCWMFGRPKQGNRPIDRFDVVNFRENSPETGWPDEYDDGHIGLALFPTNSFYHTRASWFPMGVAVADIVVGELGWIQLYGPAEATINGSGTHAQGASLYTTGTFGHVGTSASGQQRIFRMSLTEARSGSGVGQVFLSFPSGRN